MRCPYCRADNDRVVDSRASHDGDTIRRRRECLSCRRRYTTYERIEEAVLRVIKRDGTRVPYDRAKVMAGLEKACWKTSVTEDQREQLVTELENAIYEDFDQEVSSQVLGELVLERLRQLDEVAFLRYASVYHRFRSAEDFSRGGPPTTGEGVRRSR